MANETDKPLDSASLSATMYDASAQAEAPHRPDERTGGVTPPSGQKPVIRVEAGPIDIGAETAALTGDGAVGGVVTFSGFCRDEGRTLKALEIEHYPGMAEREITAVCARAAERWPLLAVTAIHRYGMIRPGEEIVFVGCASAHRGAAFAAAEFIMDFMKTSAPFWKREHLKDGSSGAWVEAKDTDDVAADRWHRL